MRATGCDPDTAIPIKIIVIMAVSGGLTEGRRRAMHGQRLDALLPERSTAKSKGAKADK